MVNTSTLLSLLQFVALAAPAIAILMQVTIERDSGNFVYHLLTSSLILIVFGGIIISYRLFTSIGQPILSLGILLIFGSFIVLAVALGYSTLSTALSSDSQMDISDFPSYTAQTLRYIGPAVVSLTIISLSFAGTVLASRGILNKYFNFGIFAGQDGLTPVIFFWVMASLLGIQTIIKLIENNLLPHGDFGDVASQTLVVVLTWIVGYAVFTGPVFIIAVVLVNVDFYILPLSTSNILLNAPYAWALFMAVILFATDIDLN